MPLFEITYYDIDSYEITATVEADDAVDALTEVVESTDDIAADSSFAIVPAEKMPAKVSDLAAAHVHGSGANGASATEGNGQPGREEENAVPPAGNTEIGTGPVHDAADAPGAIPLTIGEDAQRVAREQLKRTLGNLAKLESD